MLTHVCSKLSFLNRLFPERLRNALDSDFMWRFSRSPVAIVSFVVFALLVLSALFAPWIAPFNPYDPSSLDLMNGFTPPVIVNDFTLFGC